MDKPTAEQKQLYGYKKSRAFLVSALLAPGAGLVASLLAVVVMGLLRLFAGAPTPVELFGDFVLKHIGVNTFMQLLLGFAPNGKTAPLGLALLAMIALGTALSWLYAALTRVRLPSDGARPTRREWLVAAGFAVGMTLLGVLLFWNELRQNQFGLPLAWDTLISALALLVDFGVYSATLCLAWRVLLPRAAQSGSRDASRSRRQFFARAGIAVLSVAAAGSAFELLRAYLGNYASYDGSKTWPQPDAVSPITPNEQHYVVTQNVVDPNPDIAFWRLEVGGLVNRPGSYTYEELLRLPASERAITLECIANGVGDHLISTAIWRGVALRTLLELHGGAQEGARYVAFYSVDGYNVSLPLDEVLAADALLAWQMNGVTLPQRHGYPLRVLIPGRYGEENPKWLTRIELSAQFVPGLYSSQGWYNGPLHTLSRIDHPRGHVALGQSVEVGGIAFAGNRGIRKVEVSVDDGATWHEAALDPPLSQDSWRFWRWQWRPTRAGSYTLVVRATDGTGALQTSREQGTVPNGATGYHHVTVSVA